MIMRNANRWLTGAAIVVLSAGVALACKDFLNTPVQGALDENTLETPAGVEGSLIAAYRSLDCSSSSAGSWGCAASNWVWGGVTSGDAYKGSEAGDQQPVNEIETFLWGVADVSDYLNQKWSQVYEGVSRANATIRLLDKVLAANPGALDSATAAGIRGEAIFLRAHYHFEAYRMWKNIPYYRETDTDFRKTNTGVDAITEILADLDQAITLLPGAPRNGDKGRAFKWTALAYKGRVQMYSHDYAGALATFHQFNVAGSDVGGEPYHLETSFDHVWTAFANYQNGPETILAYEAAAQDNEPSGWNSNWGERLNFPNGGHFACCGFYQPSQNLVNFFAVDANGLPRALTDPTWNDQNPAFNDPTAVQSFHGGILSVAVDPRLDWTVGRDAVPYKDWGLHDRSWIRKPDYSGPYSPKKNAHEDAAGGEDNQGWTFTQTNDVNIHIYRYADLLLLEAEAEVEAGVLENARAIVNSIRARASQVAQGCGDVKDQVADSVLLLTYPTCAGDTRMAIPLDVKSTSLDTLTTPWATYRIGLYTVPWTDQVLARQYVRTERRLELAMEGQRFFDLRRWGGADTTINTYIATEKALRPYLAGAAYASRNDLYPIPPIQIELSKVGGQDRLVQNPGW